MRALFEMPPEPRRAHWDDSEPGGSTDDMSAALTAAAERDVTVPPIRGRT